MKTYLRSTMTQTELNNVMLLHCHKEATKDIDVLKVAAEFAARYIERTVFLRLQKKQGRCYMKQTLFYYLNAFIK